MLRHGSIYLRPDARDDLPRFVRWLSDARTSRTLALISPLSQALEERWFEQVLERQSRDRWHFVVCLLADDRPLGAIELFDLDTTNGSAGLGIVIGDPDDTVHGPGSDALRALIDFSIGELRLELNWLHRSAYNELA